MRKKKVILILICVVVYLLYAKSCFDNVNNRSYESKQQVEEYVPIKEFKASYDALRTRLDEIEFSKNTPSYITKDTGNVSPSVCLKQGYDIEETVRIINGLEIAQSQSDDFYSFLEYMARQDYSLVAEDVIRAKMKLLPLLQHTFILQKKHEQLSTIWKLIRSLGSGIKTVMTDSEITQSLVNPKDLSGKARAFSKASLAVFNSYEQENKLEKELLSEIERLKELYLEYINDFYPTYIKYLREWDRLCVDKDKAYLDLYSGRNIDAYNSTVSILEKYPNNREALLLKSLSLINIGSGYYSEDLNSLKLNSSNKEIFIPDSSQVKKGWNEFYLEANNTLDTYISNYPDRSAPALLLRGLLNHRMGNDNSAVSLFDQAAMEYPRQAEKLTDLLDSYRNRTYLNKTPEGQYLLKLYRSTMEGYGIFSPNFHKAQHYSKKGDVENSKKELFNHFFRRGNQGIYDCLLSDMQYCEKYLYDISKQLLLERYYLDVSVEESTGLFSDDNEIEVVINNRSDIDFENVRLFLCIHYTDMYTDEYDVIKTPSVNLLKHYESKLVGKIKLEYNSKEFKDITRVRAIAMTDDRIFWIDDPIVRTNKIDINNMSFRRDPLAYIAKKDFLDRNKLNIEFVLNTLHKGHNIIADIVEDSDEDEGIINNLFGNSKKESMTIELPRILAFLDPVFSIGQIKDSKNSILPKENYLAGIFIRLKFDYKPKKNVLTPLYMYSSFFNLRMNILNDGRKCYIKDIEVI